MNVTLYSFGYDKGIPKQCTKVYDIRKFPCPSASTCSKYNGTHSNLRNEILNLSVYQELITEIVNYIETECKDNEEEELVLGIGCSHGKHRSVAVVEHLSKLITATVIQRDLNRKKRDIQKQNEYDNRRKVKYLLNNQED